MSEHIGFLLNDTARLFRRSFNLHARESGMTALQWRLMGYLRRNEGIRQGPLADLIEVEPITLSRMVDRLAEAGFVERRADPDDRRAWRLYLAPKAIDRLEEFRERSVTLVDAATEGLTEEQIATLTELVEHVRNNLSRRES